MARSWDRLVEVFPAALIAGGVAGAPDSGAAFDATPPPDATERPLKIIVSGRPGAGKTALLRRFPRGSTADVPADVLSAYGDREGPVDLFAEAGRASHTVDGRRYERFSRDECAELEMDAAALARLAALNVLKAQLSDPAIVAVAEPGLFNCHAWSSSGAEIRGRLLYCLATEYADLSRRYDLRFVHLHCSPDEARRRRPVSWTEATEPFHDFLGREPSRALAEEHPRTFIFADVSRASAQEVWTAIEPLVSDWFAEKGLVLKESPFQKII